MVHCQSPLSFHKRKQLEQVTLCGKSVRRAENETSWTLRSHKKSLESEWHSCLWTFRWTPGEQNPSYCKRRASPRPPHKTGYVQVHGAGWRASQSHEGAGWYAHPAILHRIWKVMAVRRRQEKSLGSGKGKHHSQFLERQEGNHMGNYRPVSLTSVPGKIMELFLMEEMWRTIWRFWWTKRWTWTSSVCLQTGRPTVSTEKWQHGEVGSCSPPLCLHESPSAVLCPDLEPTAQERCRASGLAPEEGQNDN